MRVRACAGQAWIGKVVARPPLWCDPLRLFLGLAETDPSNSATPFRHSDEGRASALSDDEARRGLSSRARAHGGGDGPGGGAAYSAELRWIISRAQQPGCGVVTEGGTGFFRGSTLVKWLLVQGARRGASNGAWRGWARQGRPRRARAARVRGTCTSARACAGGGACCLRMWAVPPACSDRGSRDRCAVA